jgi:hypothetical protein
MDGCLVLSKALHRRLLMMYRTDSTRPCECEPTLSCCWRLDVARHCRSAVLLQQDHQLVEGPIRGRRHRGVA